MKIPGLILGGLVIAASASAAGVCDSPDCPACHVVGNSVASAWPVLIGAVLIGAIGVAALKARRGGIAAMLALLLAFAGSSFADERKADAATNEPTKATIADLLAKPDAYAGKEVTVQARLAGVCAGDGCLTLKDKLDVIEGKPPAEGFKKTPKAGALLNVTGTVKVRGEGDKKEVAIAVRQFEEVKK